MRSPFATIRALLVAVTFAVHTAQGQPIQDEKSLVVGGTEAALNNVYIDFGTGLFIGGVSLNYERMVTDNLAVRTGLGLGYAADYGEGDSDAGTGTMIMVHYITSDSDYRFEGGFGLSVIYFPHGFFGGDVISTVEPGGWGVFPAVSIGYRYQQRDGGFFFAAGVSYTYFMVAPIHFSFGHTF